MVPPPDNAGDEFPDFDNMTLEEQMAWLESLARRQGVSSEQLTTSADLDIPVPENAQVDEPGYVPFEGSKSARLAGELAAKQAQEQAQAEPEEPAEPLGEVEPVDQLADLFAAAGTAPEVQPEPDVLAFDSAAEPLEASADSAADPMQWLDSLAAQSGEEGAGVEGFAEAEALGWSVDEELPDFDLDQLAAEPVNAVDDAAFGLGLAADEEAAFESLTLDDEHPEISTAEMEALLVSDEDPLAGVDPMLWLESLAARQGARMEEMTTSANLDIESMPEDTVVDEPGYVPFEGSRSARSWGEAAPQAADGESEPVASGTAPEAAPEAESLAADDASGMEFDAAAEWSSAAEISEADFELSELFGEEPVELPEETQPGSWLDSLSRLPEEEIVEAEALADLDSFENAVEEEPEQAAPIAYGEVEQAGLGDEVSLLADEAAADLSGEDLAAYALEDDFDDEALLWLEDLAAEPEEGVADFLVVEDDAVALEAIQPAEETEASEAFVSADEDDPLAGMTDEEIAYAQAHGQLTGEQELAWLKRQAAHLAEVRAGEEEAVEEALEEEVGPAQLADVLPDWLQEMRPEDEVGALALPDDVLEGAPEGEALDWLDEEGAGDVVALGLTSEAGEITLEDDLNALWPTDESSETVLEEPVAPESELEAFLKSGLSPDEADPLAEALDAEYDRELTGDESEPAWYAEAVAQTAGDSVEEAASAAEVPGEPVLTEASQVDMPDWLLPQEETEETAGEAVLESAPEAFDWLSEQAAPEAVVSDEEMPDWLSEDYTAVEESAALAATVEPDWLNELDHPVEDQAASWLSETPVTPPPQTPARRVQPEVAAQASSRPLPTGELYETYRQKLEENPEDHINRLALARALRTSQEVVASLDQYEALIETAQLLEDVADDLTGLVDDQPELPRARRLLGDVYVRRGQLKDALEAYRSALDQL